MSKGKGGSKKRRQQGRQDPQGLRLGLEVELDLVAPYDLRQELHLDLRWDDLLADPARPVDLDSRTTDALLHVCRRRLEHSAASAGRPQVGQ